MNTKSLVKALDKITGTDESLGKTLRAIRLCDENTLSEFSKLLDVTISYLSDIEKGRKIVSPQKAYEYAELLGYSTKEFVRLALQDEANKFMAKKGFFANITLNFSKIAFA